VPCGIFVPAAVDPADTSRSDPRHSPPPNQLTLPRVVVFPPPSPSPTAAIGSHVGGVRIDSRRGWAHCDGVGRSRPPGVVEESTTVAPPGPSCPSSPSVSLAVVSSDRCSTQPNPHPPYPLHPGCKTSLPFGACSTMLFDRLSIVRLSPLDVWGAGRGRIGAGQTLSPPPHRHTRATHASRVSVSEVSSTRFCSAPLAPHVSPAFFMCSSSGLRMVPQLVEGCFLSV
jgi:hypothetical protein